MLNLKIDTYLKFIFVISLVSIISAYYIEHILGHQPCNLCLIERLPYGLSVVVIVINHILPRYEKKFILVLTLLFIFSFIISIYHFGIEQGIFQESAVCSLNNMSETISKEDLLRQLSQKIVSCKDVTFRIFGLSLTNINMFLSLFLIILSLKTFINYEKFKS